MASSASVKFSVDQGRRIAAVVRAHEKRVPDATSPLSPALEDRQIPNQIFAVKVYIDGGSAGSGSTTCSFTYTVKNLAETVTLGTAKSPKVRRLVNVPYTTTPNGSIGSAYFDEAGALQLFDANETPDLESCT